jgi:iron complex outermembrane recepter protein
MQGKVTPNWNVIVTYAYTNARVLVDTNTPSTAGFRMTNVPYNMGSLWNTYDINPGDRGIWSIGGGVVVRGASVDASNTINTPGYGIVNLMARYSTKWGKSKVIAQLNVDNLFDKQYYVSATYNYIGTPAPAGGYPFVGVTYGNPISAMGSLKVEF